MVQSTSSTKRVQSKRIEDKNCTMAWVKYIFCERLTKFCSKDDFVDKRKTGIHIVIERMAMNPCSKHKVERRSWQYRLIKILTRFIVFKVSRCCLCMCHIVNFEFTEWV